MSLSLTRVIRTFYKKRFSSQIEQINNFQAPVTLRKMYFWFEIIFFWVWTYDNNISQMMFKTSVTKAWLKVENWRNKNKTNPIRAKHWTFWLAFNWSRIVVGKLNRGKVVKARLIISKVKCCKLSRVWS